MASMAALMISLGRYTREQIANHFSGVIRTPDVPANIQHERTGSSKLSRNQPHYLGANSILDLIWLRLSKGATPYLNFGSEACTGSVAIVSRASLSEQYNWPLSAIG
jgi:hypothetical protein